MLEAFRKWADWVQPILAASGATTLFGYSEPSNKRSAWFDFDTGGRLARITFWESGESYAEILDAKSQVTLYSRHATYPSGIDLREEYREFVNLVLSPDR
jgi:hypothetical protein